MNKIFALVSIVALSLQMPIAGSAQTANVQQIAQANTANDYLKQGNAKYQAGDKQGAIADFDRVIQLDPQSAEAYRKRGFIKAELGDKKGAIVDYDRAIQLNPKAANYLERGNVKAELGDKKGAIAD
jgi:Flp pilus assembly protein TadD